jgi:multiple sugar transport system permease protein
MDKRMKINTRKKKMSYAKWGYILLIPFFVVFIIFQFIPLMQTFNYSFYEYYSIGLTQIGPTFVGIYNYIKIFQGSILKYAGNTIILWILCIIPQMSISLLLAVWFTDIRLHLRATGFFKTIIYMPNLVMAAAFGMLFQMLFASNGPIVDLLIEWGWIQESFNIGQSVWGTRAVIALMNFLMWFGNTTILLMAGVMGIDNTVYEAATIDGSGPFKTFFHITMPLLMPIFIYVLITSLIGGVQLFDVAQLFTGGSGAVDGSSKTLMMYLYKLIATSRNYGEAGAVSVVLFVVTAFLSFIVFAFTHRNDNKLSKKQKRLIKEYNLKEDKNDD